MQNLIYLKLENIEEEISCDTYRKPYAYKELLSNEVQEYLKEKILEDGKIYEILNYQKTTNLFKIKMEEGIFLKFMVERIIEM